MSEQLYRKTMRGKQVRYVPVDDEEVPELTDVDQNSMITLITTLVMSVIISVEDQLPKNGLYRRRIEAVEKALVSLSKINGRPLNADMVTVGVKAWNTAIATIQESLTD